jgi:hypothetical protein
MSGTLFLAKSTTTRPTTFHVWNIRGCQCSLRLLMMGGVSSETCWASYKYGIITCWILSDFTVWILQWYTDPRTSNLKVCSKYNSYRKFSPNVRLLHVKPLNCFSLVTVKDCWVFKSGSTQVIDKSWCLKNKSPLNIVCCSIQCRSRLIAGVRFFWRNQK